VCSLTRQLARGPAGQVAGHAGQPAAIAGCVAGLPLAASPPRWRLRRGQLRVILGFNAAAPQPGRPLHGVPMRSRPLGLLPGSWAMLGCELVRPSRVARQRRRTRSERR
jgi:hypothetical protein